MDDNSYGYVSVITGTILTLIGFIVPFKREKDVEGYGKFGNGFKYLGITFIIVGIMDLL